MANSAGMCFNSYVAVVVKLDILKSFALVILKTAKMMVPKDGKLRLHVMFM